jgi:hypothetical protein
LRVAGCALRSEKRIYPVWERLSSREILISRLESRSHELLYIAHIVMIGQAAHPTPLCVGNPHFQIFSHLSFGPGGLLFVTGRHGG